MKTEMKKILLHEVFGFSTPIPGFEKPLEVPQEIHPFTPEIDPEYVFEPDMVSRVLRSYGSRENIMLTGEKGTGKTSFVQQFCARLNIPLMTICGGPGLDETYLMGGKSLESGSVKSVDGVLSYCLRYGIAVLIDELAAIKPPVLVSINDVLNGDQMITLKHHGLDPNMLPADLAKEEGSLRIKRHNRFRFFATDNTGGKLSKDPRYVGVNTQNSAVRSRFTCFKMGFLAPALEYKALLACTSNLLPSIIGKHMVELAIRVRASFEEGEMYETVSFRELKRWARKSLAYGSRDEVDLDSNGNPKIRPEIHKSFVDAVYTGLEESDQDMVTNTFELVFSTKLELTHEYTLSAKHHLASLEKGLIQWDAA
tara:strand:+ start:120 stop:1223 length:1104 start_codon:yes stop_codon:yes gene_type:complete